MLHVDHMGYAVKRTDRAVRSFEALGYRFEPAVRDKSRKIDITFGEFDGYKIELVCPYESGSPVDGVLGNAGNMPYHICYRSDDFDKDIDYICKNGYKVIIHPAEAAAFDGRKVCFLYSLGCRLIEVVEDEKGL